MGRGYGKVSLPVHLAVGYRSFYGPAHRVTYTLLRGRIPEGMELDHLCRNTTCVNPWHLEPVTGEENKRRHWTGPTAKFGTARQLRSGRWQAAYVRQGERVLGPRAFDTETDARAWLESQRGLWLESQR